MPFLPGGLNINHHMQLDIHSTRNRKIIDFRKLAFDDLRVLGKYNYNKSEQKLPNHKHSGMIEICYYDKGSQYFQVNGSQYLVKGGDVFIHYPGELHGSGGHPEEKGALYWMIIRLNKTGNDTLNRLCEHLIEKQRRHFKGNKDIKKILEGIFMAYTKREVQKMKKLRIYLMAQTFILALLDCIENEVLDTENMRLNKIIEYINKNIHEQISIATMAKQINLSESRFKTLFKELTGFTPGDYIQRRKVELALKRINENPKISLSRLAYELSFSSPQYFSTVMKKYTGKSPSFFTDYAE